MYKTGGEYECKTPKHDNNEEDTRGEPQHEHRWLKVSEYEIDECKTPEFGENEVHEQGELEYEPTCSNRVDKSLEGKDNGI